MKALGIIKFFLISVPLCIVLLIVMESYFKYKGQNDSAVTLPVASSLRCSVWLRCANAFALRGARH